MAEDWLVLKGLKWAWNNRTEILDYLGKLRLWFRTDEGRGILIIGAGGVGKSTLARILSGQFDWLLDELWRYDESFGVEEFALKDDPKTNIVVPPGQNPRREAMWVDVERNLAVGQYRGVIVVNAFGYHTLTNISYKEHPLYTGSKESFLASYLEACRQDELVVLKRIVGFLTTAPGRMWLLSVVAKEDLWESDAQPASRFYNEGEYANLFDTASKNKGAANFRHELVRTSLLLSSVILKPLRAKNSKRTQRDTITDALWNLCEGYLKQLTLCESGSKVMSESNGTSVLEREEQVRLVLGLLKEYTNKLSSLNADIIDLMKDPARGFRIRAERVAWLLDQGELLRKPLSQIISRGSGFLEHSNLDTTTEYELALRMREIEIHLHHALRLTYELKQLLDQEKYLGDQVPKLRLAAGLNAMKGGPLRPD